MFGDDSSNDCKLPALTRSSILWWRVLGPMFAWPLSPEELNTASLCLLEYILLPAPESASRLSMKPVSSYLFGVGSLTVVGL